MKTRGQGPREQQTSPCPQQPGALRLFLGLGVGGKKKIPLERLLWCGLPGSGRLRALRGRGSGGRGASGGAPVDAVSWGALSRALPGRLRLAGSRRGAICRICPRAPARKASSSRSREKIFSEAGKKTGTCPQQPSLSSFSPASLPRERFCVLGKYGSGFFFILFFFGRCWEFGTRTLGLGAAAAIAASCCRPGSGLVVNQIRIFAIYRKYLPKYC